MALKHSTAVCDAAASGSIPVIQAKGAYGQLGEAKLPQDHSGASRIPFLRVPPFPGNQVSFTSSSGQSEFDNQQVDELVDLVRELRVGGCYWGAQPDVPHGHVLVRSMFSSSDLEGLAAGAPIVCCPAGRASAVDVRPAARLEAECDPWHVLSQASALVVEDYRDEFCIVAAMLDVPVYRPSRIGGELERQDYDAAQLLMRALPADTCFLNPFTGEPMTARETVELCGFWRRMIDSNRGIAGGIGFAFWKQANVAALLWDGSKPFAFLKRAPSERDAAVAVWRSRTPAHLLARVRQSGARLVEVEDGFLRSQGLGADCVPPLSLTVDRLGAYFDPGCPSELELLLQNGEFDEELLARARRLRNAIVAAGLGKYERGHVALERPGGRRRHILVPGQVEDDRSVQTGGSGLTANLELLARVREYSPDSYILYKPHPDVVAGHRKGSVPERACLQYADKIVGSTPISSLVDMVDEVHVNTSLTGFEALMRDKPVTTFGVPFYAGWGVSTDLGPVPSRRTRRRSIDELVAAALLLYPRYLDPVTRLPCPAEIIVERLSTGIKPASLAISLRRLQGRFMRRLRSLAP